MSPDRKAAPAQSLRENLDFAWNRASQNSAPDFDVYYTGIAMDASPETGKCPALAHDGRCGIYARRPRICRTVPFEASFPRQHQAEALLDFQRRMQEIGGACDFGKSAPVIHDGHAAKDPANDAAFIDDAPDPYELAFAKTVAEHYLRNHLEAGDVTMDDFARLAVDGTEYITVPYYPVIWFMCGLKRITTKDAACFYERQIRLIERLLSELRDNARTAAFAEIFDHGARLRLESFKKAYIRALQGLAKSDAPQPHRKRRCARHPARPNQPHRPKA